MGDDIRHLRDCNGAPCECGADQDRFRPRRLNDVSWSGHFDESAPHILAALQRLIDCPEVFRPFVVIEDKSAGLFVQFAGSTERGLLFDVPALGIVAFRCPSAAVGVSSALVTLRQLGVPRTATVHVSFETTRNAPVGPRPAEC